MNDVEGRRDLSMEQLRSYAVEGLVAGCVRCGRGTERRRSGVLMTGCSRLESLAEPIPIVP
jgi:hypothetical protein